MKNAMLRSIIIYSILAALLTLDALWWKWADRRLRAVHHPRIWRVLLALFMGSMLAYIAGLTTMGRATRAFHYYLPSGIIVAIYLWHVLVLPITWLSIGLAWPIRRALATKAHIPSQLQESSEPYGSTGGPDSAGSLSRRQLLGAMVVAVPPVVTFIGTARAIPQLEDFRLTRRVLRLPRLPQNLDGLTIAHLSDVHVGRFTRGPVLEKIVEATNQLHADLVLMPGDLIDFYLSDLPEAAAMVRRLDSRHGTFMCEGNHDLIESPQAFDNGVRREGLQLLRNASRLLPIRGETLQLLGVNWALPESSIEEEMSEVTRLVRPELFSILLAHHPHNWDPAIKAGIDLTLAGHTHGGQLMLNKHFGAGSIMFRYFSGLYERAGKQLYVSNGVGNWFPLRINAPAEIVHLTLRRA